MSRRRELMAALTGGNSDLLYERRNLAVETGAQIDTGVKPFTVGQSITILIDFTNTENPTGEGAVASKWKLIRIYSVALSLYTLVLGKTDRASSALKFWFYEALSAGMTMDNNLLSNLTRKRVAITHEAGSNTAYIKYKMGESGTLRSYSRTKTFTADDTVLTFGGPAEGDHALPAGTFDLIQVWGKVLTDDEINSFFE